MLRQHIHVGDTKSDVSCLQKSFMSRNEKIRMTSQAGPGCSKLKTSLVNVLLKFQMLIFQIQQIFLLKKCELLSFFQQKNSVFGYKVVKYLS